MRELEQRQKAKGKQRADPEGDLKISDLPEQFHDAVNLARSVLAKDATGGHNSQSHRWSELLYKVRPQASSLYPYCLITHTCRPMSSTPSSTPLSK